MLQLLDPLGSSYPALSAFFGYISMGCWIVATLPQILENWQRKSAEGLAPLFVLIWVAGDSLNLLAGIRQHVLTSMIVLAAYYVGQDLVLVYQLVYYRSSPSSTSQGNEARKPNEADERAPLLVSSSALSVQSNEPDPTCGVSGRMQAVAFGAFILAVGVIGTVLDTSKDTEPDLTWVYEAQIMGWISAVLYLSARIPQILKNRTTRCEGLAPGMFILSVFANATYVASILAKSTAPEFLKVNASWLVGAGGVIIFDFILLAQFYAYKR